MFAIVDPPRGCLNHTTKSKDFNPYYVKQTLHHAQSSIKPLHFVSKTLHCKRIILFPASEKR
ncbi:hypothetical protein QE82_21650 [Salmonella enterica subsp. enterica serovar Rubislaw]|nr:hypothetical protein [Salmonella enterica subsp. enterica serovar Rubislaw]